MGEQGGAVNTEVFGGETRLNIYHPPPLISMTTRRNYCYVIMSAVQNIPLSAFGGGVETSGAD